MNTELFTLKGKTAVVTGAAGLLGMHHCIALSNAGANVVACDIDKNKCDNVLERLTGEKLSVQVDITGPQSVEALKKLAFDTFGSVDILVNNAAVNDMFENPLAAAEQSRFENYPLKLWQRSLNVNITGMFLCSQIIGKEMAERRAGSIINIASTYGIVAPDQSLYKDESGGQSFYKSAAYPVTKGAVISFTKFLAAYWGEKGVRVNSISPGGVENNQEEYFIKNYSARTPLKRMAKPDDYEGSVVFLASDASSYMTGANLVVDGGWTIW